VRRHAHTPLVLTVVSALKLTVLVLTAFTALMRTVVTALMLTVVALTVPQGDLKYLEGNKKSSVPGRCLNLKVCSCLNCMCLLEQFVSSYHRVEQRSTTSNE
jgi:hypothetical protein